MTAIRFISQSKKAIAHQLLSQYILYSPTISGIHRRAKASKMISQISFNCWEVSSRTPTVQSFFGDKDRPEALEILAYQEHIAKERWEAPLKVRSLASWVRYINVWVIIRFTFPIQWRHLIKVYLTVWVTHIQNKLKYRLKSSSKQKTGTNGSKETRERQDRCLVVHTEAWSHQGGPQNMDQIPGAHQKDKTRHDSSQCQRGKTKI